MNFDEKMQNYLDILKSATETDEAACAELRAGRRQGAKEKFSRASALYARAASELLELMDMADPSEWAEYQKSVERLIAVSEQMKGYAEAAGDAEKGTKAGEAGGAPKTVPGNDSEDEEAAFAPVAEKPKTTMDQIFGLEDAKQVVMDEIINPLLYEDVYRRYKLENQGGLLLFGPPGGGKTMMARAIAAESGYAFYPVRCSDIVGRYFGDAEKRVRALFDAARKDKNAVVFLDEAEALASRRGGHSTVMNRLVPELLSQMDGFEKAEGHLIVIFATNRPYDLDPAFLRPGRLATHCYIPLPDYRVRFELLKKQIEARPCREEIDIAGFAKRTERYSCADLVNLVAKGCHHPIHREIAARKSGAESTDSFLTQADLERAFQTVHPSVETEEIRRLEKWMAQMGIHYKAA